MSFMWAGGTFGNVLGIQATESYESKTSSSGPVAA
jgi:hypothetical protein